MNVQTNMAIIMPIDIDVKSLEEIVMFGLQPLIDNLLCTFAAPVQAWSEQFGEIRDATVQGIYLADTRLLREASLSVSVDDVHPVVGEVKSHGSARFVRVLRNRGMATDPEVTLTLTRVVFPGSASEGGWVEDVLEVENASSDTFETSIDLRLVPDASAMDVVKFGDAGTRPDRVEVSGHEFSWQSATCTAKLSLEAMEANLERGVIEAQWPVRVRAGETARASWRLELSENNPVVGPPSRVLDRTASKQSGDLGNGENPMLERALSDIDGLLMSHGDYPELRFTAAGAPWFFTLFGRDSLITARFLLDVDPSVAADTVRLLAKLQGTKVDPVTAEQPGKILHEVRRAGISPDPNGAAPSLPPIYYGTIDATPLWISLVREVWKRGVLGAEIEELLPNLRAALAWMRDFGDADGDGFLEYLDESGAGLANQGWKDSGDSVRWMDGSIAEGPIALCEVQAYAHKAALDGAEMLEALAPGSGEATEWRAWAAALKEKFRNEFWVETPDGRYPAIALDAKKRRVDSLTSNVGHLLGTGIIDEDEARGIVSLLVKPNMFSGLGIRTISTSNKAYWPMRYHVGSVWPHDTAVCIEGMLAEGFIDEAKLVARGLEDAAKRFNYRLPELFGGEEARVGATPMPYPASCRPQAWAAAATVIVEKSLRA